MNITAINVPLAQIETPCLIVPVWQGEPLSGAAAELDQLLAGLLQEVIDEDGFKGSAGETRTLYGTTGVAARRVIVLGLGKRGQFKVDKLRKSVSKGGRAARALKKASFALVLPEVEELDARQCALATAEGLHLGLHLYNDLKTGDDAPTATESVTLVCSNPAAAQQGADYAALLAAANLNARALVNRPSNLKTPEYLAEYARQIAAEGGLRIEVWDETRIQEERMGALWAVGMGSDAPPRFIVLEYVPEGCEDQVPLALVGKGMTFDTGGYSLKPSTSMEEMKDDMAGAAVVLATMAALPTLGLKRRVLGVVASAENMVSGRAQRPGDIVTARNGKTIEVLNTDAEGRLILADALSWVSEQKPAAIIDLATLTGAIGIALGQEAAGLFTNDDELGASLQRSGVAVGERLWPLPIWDEYKDAVKGHYSDLKNIAPERRAGAIIGAVFLEKFVGEGLPWAHLDIAAVSLVKDERFLTARGATGFGVRLLLDYLTTSGE